METIDTLIKRYKLTNHSDTIFSYVEIFCNKIESLNNNYFFDREKRIKGYNEQYNELKEYIYKTTPDSIKLSFGGKQVKLFEGTPKEETRFFPPNEFDVTNKILIEEILTALNGIQQPNVKPITDRARHDTFRAEFLKSTRPLYDFIVIHNKQTKKKHKFICELLELLGFSWQEVKDPEKHLKRKYKEK